MTTTRTAWFHCFSGIAGDMALGALVDAGAELPAVEELLRRLPVDGWELEAEPVLRCGIAATKVHVRVAGDDEVVRTASHILGLVHDAGLPDPVARRATATFKALAETEGRLHRRPPEQVHFHEVGGIDAIVDVVGTCAALWLLEVDDVQASAVANGTGMVRAAHGLLPNPVPAVVDLLTDAPTYGVDLAAELTTPTGAALLAASVSRWGALPAVTVETSGFGAGQREFDGRPNAVQVIVGTAPAADGDGGPTPRFARPGQPVLLFEANLDDATGEVLAHTIQALLDAGAHDAWVTPAVMKKGRPAHVVSALTDPARAEDVLVVVVERELDLAAVDEVELLLALVQVAAGDVAGRDHDRVDAERGHPELLADLAEARPFSHPVQAADGPAVARGGLSHALLSSACGARRTSRRSSQVLLRDRSPETSEPAGYRPRSRRVSRRSLCYLSAVVSEYDFSNCCSRCIFRADLGMPQIVLNGHNQQFDRRRGQRWVWA
jgi:pyridinium-3,5-bisthiocarboxylic acid mononucleotide nickel chelatase